MLFVVREDQGNMKALPPSIYPYVTFPFPSVEEGFFVVMLNGKFEFVSLAES